MNRDSLNPREWFQAWRWLHDGTSNATYKEYLNMTQIQDMIETLAAAKVAMEENPQLKSRVEQLESTVAEWKTAHEVTSMAFDQVSEDHAAAKARMQALEAELEAARFREQATMEKLDTVVSALKGAVNELMPAPVPAAAEEASNVVEESTAVLKPGAPTEVDEYNPDLNAVDYALDENRLKAERTAKAEDFSPSSEPQARSYYGKAYSMKPASLTWPAWIDGGGQRPWWLNDDELDKIRQGSALAS